jgi:hypothetical protein
VLASVDFDSDVFDVCDVLVVFFVVCIRNSLITMYLCMSGMSVIFVHDLLDFSMILTSRCL